MGSAQQVILILGVSLQAGPDVVFHIVLLQVEDIQLGGAGLEGLLLQTVQLGALTHVTGNRDNLAVVVVFLQPGNDDRGIQTAGIGQNHFFDVFLILFHDNIPLSGIYQGPRDGMPAAHLEYLFIHCCILYTLLYILQVVNPPKDSLFWGCFWAN